MSPSEFLFSFVVTWTIILIPPAAFRFLVIRRPLKSKRIAIAISGALLLVNNIVFSVLGSQSRSHLVILLGAFASFYLLKYETKEQVKERIAHERKKMGYD